MLALHKRHRRKQHGKKSVKNNVRSFWKFWKSSSWILFFKTIGNPVDTPETLGSWTDGRISCRHSTPTFLLLVARRVHCVIFVVVWFVQMNTRTAPSARKPPPPKVASKPCTSPVITNSRQHQPTGRLCNIMFTCHHFPGRIIEMWGGGICIPIADRFLLWLIFHYFFYF